MQSHDEMEQPSDWVYRFAPVIRPGGNVLDLACGGGRHARYLAGQGLLVEAVDRDVGALTALAKVAGVSTRCADLEGARWPYEDRRFDAIVVVNYLHRPLLPLLLRSLPEWGVLIYETFMRGNERFGRPSNSAFLLEPDELLEAVRGELGVLAFEQGEVTTPRPAVIQRICALRTRDVTSIKLPEYG